MELAAKDKCGSVEANTVREGHEHNVFPPLLGRPCLYCIFNRVHCIIKGPHGDKGQGTQRAELCSSMLCGGEFILPGTVWAASFIQPVLTPCC